MGQPAFFYYNPEPNTDHRQHGHFSSTPNVVQDGMQMHSYQQQQYYNEMMMQQNQQHIMYPHLPSSGHQLHMNQKSMLPMVSPQPLHQKPTFLYQYESRQLSLDTDCNTPDVYVYPSTPPLSSSGSTSSSPPSTCDILPTPVTGSYMGLDNTKAVKEGCEGDVQSEILAGGDWTRCCSPPLTPGTFCHFKCPSFWCLNLIRILRSTLNMQKFGVVAKLTLCRVRSIYPPAFANGQPSLRPPFHQVLSFPLSFPITSTTVCLLRHRL